MSNQEFETSKTIAQKLNGWFWYEPALVRLALLADAAAPLSSPFILITEAGTSRTPAMHACGSTAICGWFDDREDDQGKSGELAGTYKLVLTCRRQGRRSGGGRAEDPAGLRPGHHGTKRRWVGEPDRWTYHGRLDA